MPLRVVLSLAFFFFIVYIILLSNIKTVINETTTTMMLVDVSSYICLYTHEYNSPDRFALIGLFFSGG